MFPQVTWGDLDQGEVKMTMLENAAGKVGEPVTLPGPGGLLTGVIGQVLQAGLAAELAGHLEDGDGAAGNRSNGSSAKVLNTEIGPVRVQVPRDRAGSFDPVLVPKQARRSGGLDAVIISLYAVVILSFRVSQGRDLRRPVVDSVADGTLAA